MVALLADRHDEGRPRAKERPFNVTAGDTHIVDRDADTAPDRCRVCGHRIFTEQSIATGLGTECRRRLRAALRGADADVAAAYATLEVVA